MLDSFKMHVFFGFSLHLDMLLQCFYCLFLPPIVSDYLAIIFSPIIGALTILSLTYRHLTLICLDLVLFVFVLCTAL